MTFVEECVDFNLQLQKWTLLQLPWATKSNSEYCNGTAPDAIILQLQLMKEETSVAVATDPKGYSSNCNRLPKQTETRELLQLQQATKQDSVAVSNCRPHVVANGLQTIKCCYYNMSQKQRMVLLKCTTKRDWRRYPQGPTLKHDKGLSSPRKKAVTLQKCKDTPLKVNPLLHIHSATTAITPIATTTTASVL